MLGDLRFVARTFFFADRGTRSTHLLIGMRSGEDTGQRLPKDVSCRSRTMRALSRMILVFWLFMILGFCVYGFLATYRLPGESFCRAMYTALTLLSGLCIVQVLEPMRRRA